jgi:heme oxygenase
MTARAALRAATAEEHRNVDTAFSPFHLGNETGYRDSLLAQAAAFLPVEQGFDEGDATDILPDWPARRRGDLLLPIWPRSKSRHRQVARMTAPNRPKPS